MCGGDKLWPKKLKVVKYQGSSQKGTLGLKVLVSLNGEWGVFVHSITSSILINPRGNLVVTIGFLQDEGGSWVGDKTVKGD